MLTENPVGKNILPPFNPTNQQECFKLAQEAYSNSLVSYKHTEMLAKRINELNRYIYVLSASLGVSVAAFIIAVSH